MDFFLGYVGKFKIKQIFSKSAIRAVKTGGPAHFRLAHSGFGLYRAGLKSPCKKTG
jgi:hypothetical protein